MIPGGKSFCTRHYKKVTHCLFDLDGTLLDSEVMYHTMIGQICEKYGKSYSKDNAVQIFGMTDREVSEEVCARTRLPLSVDEFERQLLDLARNKLPIAPEKPGADRLLTHLFDYKVPMALATNSTEQSVRLVSIARPKLFGMFNHMMKTSPFLENKLGVPQGSILLGPLFFLIYIKEFSKVNPHISALFAYDASVLILGKGLSHAEYETSINTTLGNIVMWSASLNLSINLSKTKYIQFRPYQAKAAKLSINYEGTPIEEVSFSDPEVDRGKPHPDIYLVAASRFPDKPKPAQCIVFEDSEVGVQAAVAAGMQVVMVPDPRLGRERTRQATLVLRWVRTLTTTIVIIGIKRSFPAGRAAASLRDFKPELFGLPPFNEAPPSTTVPIHHS
ncbi:hypothetical protein MSG28_015337 [Choristoneura fumiferana]|uniref:Uncharacterized protein n=1 Tax=Choristoneura fumiferana TaxID=7141 RepID=A0ACC0KAR5_CHOFU|nr:hypothetical protein MSG28_015337 [Choristoneura fumiferana]